MFKVTAEYVHLYVYFIRILVHTCNAWTSQEGAVLEGTADVSMIVTVDLWLLTGFGI